MRKTIMRKSVYRIIPYLYYDVIYMLDKNILTASITLAPKLAPAVNRTKLTQITKLTQVIRLM